MRIDRLLLLGIITLAVFIVVITATLLTRDMLNMGRANLKELDSVATSVKEQNTMMFSNVTRKAAEVSTEINNASAQAATEQLQNVAESIAQEIKAVMDAPFFLVQAMAGTLLFAKTEPESREETPSREWVERYLTSFLAQRDEITAVFCGWEKDAFDGKDEEFVGKENPDDGMYIANASYVSEGAFIPWFYKEEDEAGNERIVRAYLDDYLVADTNYYVGPRESKKEFITEPYVENDIPITSFCVPIMQDDEVLGVAGLDVSLVQLQEIVKGRTPFETGFAMFFSPEGAVVYYPDEAVNFKMEKNEENGEEEKVYQNIKDIPKLAETARRIKENRTDIYTSTTLPGREGVEMLVVHLPMQFGSFPSRWTVVVVAPASKVMERRNAMRKGMDEMIAGIETQNNVFVAKLDSQVGSAVESSGIKASKSLWRAVRIGCYVLVGSIIIGSFFAVWVNRAIRAEDFRFRQMLNASTDPVSVVDMEMKIVFLNKAALVLLDKSLDDCIGRSVDDIWKSVIGDKEYANCGLRALQFKGQPLSKVDFHGVDWEVTSNYIVDVRDTKNGMIEIFKDVTDRENIFRLIQQVEGVMQSTVEQASSIAKASSDLSHGAMQQADSVESITVDMKSANDQSQKNAESASQANHLSGEAGKAAALGQERMKEMVVSMNQINENAKNMRAVIKTIDDIAFQTNLLALNAAVEAARAGTHGKGFAVVAEEVRNLAARSAKAAQETEDLIVKSNQQIDGGVVVAGQTSEALNVIAEHVTEVSTLIQQIATASKEQTDGVLRMTGTLQTVDQITQQNVDLASTTANASQQLTSEVKDLQNLLEKLHKTDF